MTRMIALILACFFLALALIGVFLPGIPTVPFLLLTAWFAARGSERLHRWLYEHPRLGKLLIDWERDRAISRTSKVAAILMLAVSWILMFLRTTNLWLLTAVTVVLISVGIFLLTRPEPR